MKKVLVTGGMGFIASYVIEELLHQGFEIITTVRGELSSRVGWLENATIYNLDMRDKAGMYSVIQKVDGVIHLAGLLGTAENMRQA